jgi:hypothetical protein
MCSLICRYISLETVLLMGGGGEERRRPKIGREVE